MSRPKFGGRIKELRKSWKMSQVNFAKLTGVSQANLSKIENGEIEPPVAFLHGLVLNQKVAIVWLFGLDDIMGRNLAKLLLEQMSGRFTPTNEQ